MALPVCWRKLTIQPPSSLYRLISTTQSLLRLKPKPVRDPSKRNFQGEKLVERLKRRDADIKAQEPYKLARAAVIERFKHAFEEEEKRKNDIQGELMKRELAEKQQILQNQAIIAANNEELRRLRKMDLLKKEEELKKQKEEKEIQAILLAGEIRKNNRDIVLRVIEESKDFVTPDNLDEKIAEVLDEEVYFNYAITPLGQKIHSSKPPGNLENWTSPSPSAYIAGGMKKGSSEWNVLFKDKLEST